MDLLIRKDMNKLLNKIVLILASTLFVFLVSCDDADNPLNPNMPDGKTNPIFVTDLSDKDLSINKDGGSISFNVEQQTQYKWVATSNQSWAKLNVSPTDSIIGDKGLTITVDKYLEVDPRTATITLKEVAPKTNRTLTITVKQSGADPVIEVDQTTIETEALGGIYIVEVTTNGATWNASSNVSWISVSPSSGKNATVSISITKNVNPETAERTGIVSFVSGSAKKTVTVSQIGYTTCHSANNTSTIYFDEFAPCEDSNVGDTWTLTDRRDNKEYKVVLMPDNQYWMIEDLRFGGDTDIAASKNTFKTDNPAELGELGEIIPDYYGDVANITFNGSSDINPREGRGYFYNWRAAVQSADISVGSDLSKTQGIAPGGWHIPSVEEYKLLRDALGIDGVKWGEDNSSVWKGIWSGDIDGGTRRNWGLGAYGAYWTSTNKMSVESPASEMGDHQAVMWKVNNPTSITNNINQNIEYNPAGVAEPVKKNKNGGALIRCIKNY